MRLGDRVQATKEIDLQPYTTIKVGERGTVRYVEHLPDGVGYEVEFDTRHPGMDVWHNTPLLVSPELECLQVIPRLFRLPTFAKITAWAAACTLSITKLGGLTAALSPKLATASIVLASGNWLSSLSEFLK